MLPEAIYLQKESFYTPSLGTVDTVQGQGLTYNTPAFNLDVKPTQSSQVQTVSAPKPSGGGWFNLDNITSLLNTGAGVVQSFQDKNQPPAPTPQPNTAMKYLPWVGGAAALIIIIMLINKKK